jgi:hypothetical protein
MLRYFGQLLLSPLMWALYRLTPGEYMSENNTDMSIIKIDQLIAEENQSIIALKNKISLEIATEDNKLNEIDSLLIKTVDCEALYYKYRDILGSNFFELSKQERESLEKLMPIYEKKIRILKEEMEEKIAKL